MGYVKLIFKSFIPSYLIIPILTVFCKGANKVGKKITIYAYASIGLFVNVLQTLLSLPCFTKERSSCNGIMDLFQKTIKLPLASSVILSFFLRKCLLTFLYVFRLLDLSLSSFEGGRRETLTNIIYDGGICKLCPSWPENCIFCCLS